MPAMFPWERAMPAIFTVRPGIGLEIAGMARSHETIQQMAQAGNLAKLGFSAVDHVKSDRLLANRDVLVAGPGRSTVALSRRAD